MLAKLIVWAPSRHSAISRMKRALDDFVVLGVRHNIDFLHRIVSSEDFAAGRLDTGFIAAHPDLLGGPSEIPSAVRLVASLKPAAAVNASQHLTDVWNSGPWRNA
jgi:acetyl/propionyl-CoA carboxylase alpha subunit